MIFFGADSPADHRMISAEEVAYIQHSLGGAKEKVSDSLDVFFTVSLALLLLYLFGFRYRFHGSKSQPVVQFGLQCGQTLSRH